MAMADAQKMFWDVMAVYKGWFQWTHQRIRKSPYSAHITLPNALMLLVTFGAVLAATFYLLKKRRAKRLDQLIDQEDCFMHSNEILLQRHLDEKKRRAKQAAEGKSDKKRAETEEEGESDHKRDAAAVSPATTKKVRSEFDSGELGLGFGKRTAHAGRHQGNGKPDDGAPVNCPFKHLFGGMMMEPDDGDEEDEEEVEDGASKDDGKATMALLRAKIHESINRPKNSGGKSPRGKPEKLGKPVDLSDHDDDDDDDECDVEELPYGRDPMDMAMHIPGELKKIKNKITTREIEKTLTEQQRQEEARARREQLEQIFKLMQDQKEKFGNQNTDDIEEQMRMYSL